MSLASAAAAADEVATDGASLFGLVILPELVAFAVAVLLALLVWWLQRRQARDDERAKLLADAYAAVQLYKEYVFVIRRRQAADLPKERQRISGELTQLQRDLSFHGAWLGSVDPSASAAFDRLVAETRRVAGQLMHDGWLTEPVTRDEQMNIPEVGAQLKVLEPFEKAYLDAAHSVRHGRWKALRGRASRRWEHLRSRASRRRRR